MITLRPPADGQIPAPLVGEVHDRVRDELLREPVEDVRVGLEEGYGHR